MSGKELYSPPSGDYPPSQSGYAGYTPPSYYPQSATSQQTGNTVVVVQPQPTVTTAVFTPVGDYNYTASIVLSFICFFCGSWWSLCCTIPAIFVASSARDAAARGDLEGARSSGRMACGLNIAAVVFYVIIWAVIIGVAVGVRSTTNCYYLNGHTYCN
ncbi:hypothetical protein EMCRGX_G010571 [Ephydatia muelleri]|eukprot:Em0003g1831a